MFFELLAFKLVSCFVFVLESELGFHLMDYFRTPVLVEYSDMRDFF